ncbi:hypothetical protein J3459_018262 [Metarhizium acridum]|nr:hypothetical protein J3459_018262 [Metarhizium acridum]
MIARSRMSPQEYEAWTTFNDRLWHLPKIDWDNNQLPPHISPRSRKIARRRAEALNRLYETDRAQEGHVTWIPQNKGSLDATSCAFVDWSKVLSLIAIVVVVKNHQSSLPSRRTNDKPLCMAAREICVRETRQTNAFEHSPAR